MAITQQKKETIVAKLSEGLKDAQSAVFVGFRGLSVGETTELRKKLREEGVKYTVAKKTLMRRVLGDNALKGDLPELPGEVAIAYGTDLLSPAREVYAFEKKFKEKVKILGGIFDGAYKNQTDMLSIASIPAPEVLRGMFVNVVNSPIQGFVIALDQIAQKKG
ncbi:MAG: 50S ribosomal protein L10 [Candidatus Yonathbacteria bacterium]|nr:50S ribosomal protein L10 [Candidatus Yonathbacteria bacterium]